MVPAELLGMLERVINSAVRVTGTYKHRPDDTARSFGGVNVIMFADFWQLHTPRHGHLPGLQPSRRTARMWATGHAVVLGDKQEQREKLLAVDRAHAM